MLLNPLGVVTTTSTVPAGSAGEVAVIEVAETTVTLVATPAPKLTALAPMNPVPVTVTVLSPAGRPATGLTAVTVGAGS